MQVERLGWAPTVGEALRAADAVAAGWGWERSLIGGAAEGVVCLHSGRRVEGLGRWSVVACAPVGQARGMGGEVEPFEAVRALLEGFPTGEGPGSGFGGGAVGVFGYGCVGAVEPSVVGLAADEVGEAVWFGLYDTWVIWDGEAGEAWVASWGLEAQGAAPSAPLAALKIGRWVAALEAARGEGGGGVEGWPGVAPGVERGAWGEAFGAVKAGIAAGALYQGCLTFPMVGARGEHTARGLFEALAAAHPAPMSALVVPPGSRRAIASASPERLLRVAGGRVSARPMKGTRPRGATEEEDGRLAAELRGSVKDQAENVMIVDLMRNDLGRVCALGSVEVPALFTLERYASVHQLTSTVEGVLAPGFTALDAARACFPPGSMTGAPKVAAMQLLAELEPGPRGWYAGALGWFDGRGDADLSVVIRAAQVEAEQLRWHVGGGIVADSEEDAEWDEALQKCPIR